MGTSTKYAIEHDGKPVSSMKTAQSSRFLEAAREAGCEENFDRFDDVLRKVASAKAPPPAPRKGGVNKPKPQPE